MNSPFFHGCPRRVMTLGAVALLAAVSVRAQDGEEGADGPSNQSTSAARRIQVTAPATSQPAPRLLEGREYVSALATVRPRRVAPGQGGTLVIVLALAQAAVVNPSSEFLVTYPTEQATFVLGNWQRLPPKPVMRYAAFENQAIYDNTLQIEIPVAVGAATAHGSHRVTIEVETNLHDGSTGNALGKYRDTIACPIAVGPPLPQIGSLPQAAPASAQAAGSAAVQPESAGGAQSGDGLTPSAQASPDSGRPEVELAAPAADQVLNPRPAAVDAPADADSNVELWLFGGLGVLALGVVLMFAMRGRR